MYERIPPDESLTQGDIVDAVTIVASQWSSTEETWRTIESEQRVIVLPQACDLAESKTSWVLVGIVHNVQGLVDRRIVKAKTVRDQIRRHKIYGWYFLPASVDLPESLVDLRAIHSVPLKMVADLAMQGHRVCRLITPYREHLAQHFSVTYSRIGLPEPYGTE